MSGIAAADIEEYTSECTTELDSHANMIVLGLQALIINHTGQSAEVNAFSSDVEGMSKFTIVDVVVVYDCPYTGKTYLLLMRNVFYIASMEHNLIPPFILREAGLTVSNIWKIHCDEPTIEDHSVYDENTKLRIPLQLDGIFLYFPTRALTLDEIQNCDQI